MHGRYARQDRIGTAVAKRRRKMEDMAVKEADLANTYRGKRVFITGHTGFKGSWLMAWLKGLGAEIKGYSLPPRPEHKLFGQIGGEDLAISFYDDILNYPSLESHIL